MDWKKFKDEVPKEKTEVLIYWGGSYYIATYNRSNDTFNFLKGNTVRNCWRNDGVYWTYIIEPTEITEEKEKYKNLKQ